LQEGGVLDALAHFVFGMVFGTKAPCDIPICTGLGCRGSSNRLLLLPFCTLGYRVHTPLALIAAQADRQHKQPTPHSAQPLIPHWQGFHSPSDYLSCLSARPGTLSQRPLLSQVALCGPLHLGLNKESDSDSQ
jgi:hypothetical protein